MPAVIKLPALLVRLHQLLLPRSLVGRVFTLFALSMLLFVVTGLGMFYRHQFLQHIEETQDAAATLVEVASQAVEDSAVIGDYDTVKRTLSTMIVQSPFRSATFIDLDGGVIRVVSAPDTFHAPAPDWMTHRVTRALFDVNRVVSVGGKDYGVLRLSFDERKLAAQLWLLLLQSAGLAAIALVVSLSIARFLLARWLQNLGRLRFYGDEGAAGAGLEEAPDADAPLEIREAIQAVNRSAASMRDQYGQRISALMSSLVQHKSALDQAAIVCEVDREGRITAVNDQFVRHTGHTRDELIGAALAQAGARPGDRIEHAGITPDARLEQMVELGVQVVSQPHFIAERGDHYLRDVEPRERPLLYRLDAFARAGLVLAAGSDAPYGVADPWAAMRAAVSRRTESGAVIGQDEALTPEAALALYLADPLDLRRQRSMVVGAPADLCLLDRPWAQARDRLRAEDVAMTWIAGSVVHDGIDQTPA